MPATVDNDVQQQNHHQSPGIIIYNELGCGDKWEKSVPQEKR